MVHLRSIAHLLKNPRLLGASKSRNPNGNLRKGARTTPGWSPITCLSKCLTELQPTSLSTDTNFQTMKPNLHRLLLNQDETFRSSSSSFGLDFPPLSNHHHLPPAPNSPKRAPINPTSTIDSCVALTILILLTALFFIGFFSAYARRLSEETTAEISRRRRQQQRGFARNPSPPQGLDLDAVRTLPCLAYGVCAKEPLDCAVCLSEFDEKETVKIIPRCGHLYHPQCIDSWLRSRGSCPLCRSTRLFPEEKEKEVRLEVLDEMSGGVAEEDGGREGRRSCEGGRLAALRRTRSWCRRTERRRAVLGRSYSF